MLLNNNEVYSPRRQHDTITDIERAVLCC